MAMKLVAKFQYMENYSFDDNGCPVDGPDARWKFKGGEEVVLTTLSYQDVVEASHAGGLEEYVRREAKARGLEWDNVASRQYLVDWELLDEDDVVISWDDEHDNMGTASVSVQVLMDELWDTHEYQGRWIEGDRKGWWFRRRVAAINAA